MTELLAFIAGFMACLFALCAGFIWRGVRQINRRW